MRILFGALAATLIHLVPGAQVDAQQQQVAPLPTSAADVRPVLVGTSLPNVSFRTATGDSVSLAEARGGGKQSVLILYRGGW